MNLTEAITLTNQGLMTPAMLDAMPMQEKLALAEEAFRLKTQLRQESQIEFYVPASERARKIHYSTAKECVAVGGNRSAKTTTTLADLVIRMTGIIPHSLPDYPAEKIACPGRYRIVCESLTNTWAPVIRQKLQWDHWNGKGQPGGPLGHWGLMPRRFLKKGKWEESWSEKERTLTLTCNCTLQINSYDQDAQDQSGSSLHLVVFDEGPPRDIYNENKMRTIDTGGQLMIAFTPPAEETTAWKAAWIYEELYEKGLPGPAKDEKIDVFELWTMENRILDQADIDDAFKGLTPAQRETRSKGAFMHLGGRIYPNYTDVARSWCFTCNDIAFVQDGRCAKCQNTTVTDFCHFVEPFEMAYSWPCVYLLDPHPRKPVMMSWIVIDPIDDSFMVAEMLLDKSPVDAAKDIFTFERDMKLQIAARLMDPKMAEQVASQLNRGVSIRTEWDNVGIRCKMADSDFAVGKTRVNDLLKPDPRTRQPRFFIFKTCPTANKQMKSYSWDEHATVAAATKRDAKITPIAKNDDFPTMIKYYANENYTYTGLKQGGKPIQSTRRPRRTAYG